MKLISLQKYYKLSLTSIILLSALLLSGCDDGDNKRKGLSVQNKVQKYSQDTILKGKVSDSNRNRLSGEIIVTKENGTLITSTQVQKTNRYSVSIPSGTELPLLLTFTYENKTTDKDNLISVVIYASIKKYDINELTTLIAKKAKSLGGYSHINMVLAADSTVGVPDANKTSTGFKGDPTKQYGGWH